MCIFLCVLFFFAFLLLGDSLPGRCKCKEFLPIRMIKLLDHFTVSQLLRSVICLYHSLSLSLSLCLCVCVCIFLSHTVSFLNNHNDSKGFGDGIWCAIVEVFMTAHFDSSHLSISYILCLYLFSLFLSQYLYNYMKPSFTFIWLFPSIIFVFHSPDIEWVSTERRLLNKIWQ